MLVGLNWRKTGAGGAGDFWALSPLDCSVSAVFTPNPMFMRTTVLPNICYAFNLQATHISHFWPRGAR